MKENTLPFLKWAGGKRWLADNHLHFFPNNYQTYIEPFLGSGAIYFELKPQKAILGDTNKDLIETYRAIRNNWVAVYEILKIHHKKHSNAHYYKTRDLKPATVVERAARFIYLNRTCWNGLYRVNLDGNFNVPIGTKSSVIFETDNFKQISKMLKKAELINGDFEAVISRAKCGDLIFVDPPYTVKHNNNGFIKYNEVLFSWKDQERLHKALVSAKKRKAAIFLTNAYNRSIMNLYKKDFIMTKLQRISKIAANKNSRVLCNELLVRG